MLGCAKSSLGKLPEGNEVCLVVVVVVPVECQFRTCHQRDRVQVAHIALPNLVPPARVVIRIHTLINEPLEIFQYSEDDQAQSREPLLAINDIELL